MAGEEVTNSGAGEQSVLERLTSYVRQSEAEPEVRDDEQEKTADASDAEPEEGPTAEGDEATQEEPAAEDEQEPAQAGTPGKTKVKVTGDDGTEEEVEVTHDELIRGYQRQADYTRKTQQLATERKSVQAEAAGHVREFAENAQRQLAQYEAAITMLTAPELQGADLMRLAVEDPAEHVRIKARLEQIEGIKGSLRSAAQRLEQARAQAINNVIQEELEASAAKLPKLIPGRNAEKAKELHERAERTYGYTPQEIDGITDARAVQVLHDAHQWRRLQESKKTAAAKQVKPPAAPKASTRPPAVKDQDKLRERYRKTGSADDWVAANQAKQDAGRRGVKK